MSTALAVVIIICSVVWKLLGDAGIDLYLVPGAVWRGAVWQLVTWVPAAQPSAGSVLISAFLVWNLGSGLEGLWGRARYLRFLLATTVITGVLTVLLALVLPLGAIPFSGADILASIAWVGFGCARWNSQTSLFGFPVTGKILALLGVGIACLNAVFSNALLLLPEFLALAMTFAYARYRLPGALLERFGSWRLERDLKNRSSHLRSIDGGKRNSGSGSDKYLH